MTSGARTINASRHLLGCLCRVSVVGDGRRVSGDDGNHIRRTITIGFCQSLSDKRWCAGNGLPRAVSGRHEDCRLESGAVKSETFSVLHYFHHIGSTYVTTVPRKRGAVEGVSLTVTVTEGCEDVVEVLESVVDVDVEVSVGEDDDVVDVDVSEVVVVVDEEVVVVVEEVEVVVVVDEDEVIVEVVVGVVVGVVVVELA